MSHEIRTPLHAIMSMSRMLMDSLHADAQSSPQELQDLTQIIRSSETLEALVNDILFIAKMENAGLELHNSAFDVCELIEDITQLLALRWAGKSVEAVTLIKLQEFSFEVRRVREPRHNTF
jgi:signal transduction histidine kinase